jgi:hypothetical protein
MILNGFKFTSISIFSKEPGVEKKFGQAQAQGM